MQSQSVDLVEMFVGLMPDAAVVVNGDGVIVAANELAQALFGYPADDLMGRPIELLVPERYRHAHRSDRADYFAEPRTRPMGAGLELTGRRRDGSEFAVDISLAPVSPDGGEPLVVAAVRDATERRTATAASAQLAAIVQSSTDAIVSMSAAGEIRSWNPGAQRLFGHAPEEAVGCHISMIVPDDRSAELEELMSAAMTGGTATASAYRARAARERPFNRSLSCWTTASIATGWRPPCFRARRRAYGLEILKKPEVWRVR